MKKLLKKIQTVLIISVLTVACGFPSQVTKASTVVSSTNKVNVSSKSVKNEYGDYIIKKGQLKSVVFSCNKIKLSNNLVTKDSYNIYVNGNLSINLSNYCNVNNILKIEILKIDDETTYDYSMWNDALTIFTQDIYAAIDEINSDWRGVVYLRVTDINEKIYISKSNGFVVDLTKPIIKVNGTLSGINTKVYKDKAVVYVKDEFSGIKQVKVNDTVISDYKNGINLNKSGKYKIQVTDKCGNTSNKTINIIK